MGESKQGLEKLEADLVALKDHVQLSKYVALATASADPSQLATSLMHVRLQENLANVQSFARYSTGDAMKAMEAIVSTLPDGIGFEWTGMSFQEKQSGSQAPILYAISVIFVFLCLAALYESWAIPASVIMVVPVGVCGALIAAFARGLENDVFFQVALLTTVGLCAKNSILIVEFARHLVEQGKKPFDAAVEAAALRLRPILMTSVAFVLGIVPLVFAKGAGAASQNSIGTSLIGGMMSSTVLAIFFTPLFFFGISVLIARVTSKAPAAPADGQLAS